jgi:hypothetical protein
MIIYKIDRGYPIASNKYTIKITSYETIKVQVFDVKHLKIF